MEKEFIIEDGILKEYQGPGGDVVIPAGVTKIGASVFTEDFYYGTDCPRAVTSVILPEGVTEIDRHAFAFCQKLTKVVLPQSLQTIGSFAFYECIELTELTFPEDIADIRDRAFAGCKKLNVALPSKLTVIEEAAFRGCGLKSIVIPAGVTKVGKEAFKNCVNIKTAGPSGGGYDYEFPWTTEIPDNAFFGLKKLTKAVLPATIQKVGGNAFNGCKALTDLTMPKEAKVHKTALKGCDKLTEVKEPVVGTPAPAAEEQAPANPDFLIANGRLVQYRGNAPEVVIPDAVTIIGRNSFWGKRIASVIIPASVTTIEQEAFEGCYQLKNVQIAGQITKVGARAFGWLHSGAIEPQIYNAIPLRAFSKAEIGECMTKFHEHLSVLDANSSVYQENIQFIGSHLREPLSEDERFCQILAEDAALRRALMEAKAIPAKDVNWAVSELQAYPDIVAELLDYKNNLLVDPKVKKSLEKSEEREAEKAVSMEMSVADWRKIFKFSYEEGEVVIKGTKSFEPEIVVPVNIGTKMVRAVDREAFCFASGKKSPTTITLSEGIREVRKWAFYLVDNSEIFFPSTITALPEGCFVAVHNLTLHLTSAVTDIHDEMVWDSMNPAIKAIYAPAGSYAEAYAKEHNIPFVAE